MAGLHRYVKLSNLQYLAQGLSLNTARCADTIDQALVGFNNQSRIPDRIVAWNQRDLRTRGPLTMPGYTSILVEVEQRLDAQMRSLYTALVRELAEAPQCFRLFLNLHSPLLDIPMRVELPLRTVLKGCGRLKGTHVVYLHTLMADDGTAYVYYGITCRGWNLRFGEHTKAAVAEEPRLFSRTFGELINRRILERTGKEGSGRRLAGVISSICAAGLSREAAMDVEEYLVDKYSLCTKHSNGLNMIPGGLEGMRVLYRLSLTTREQSLDTAEREGRLCDYMRTQVGSTGPRPAMVERWNDPAYAEAVICGRENRLSGGQVREVRYRAALGEAPAAIAAAVDALSVAQVQRVLDGRSYGRVI